MPALRHRIEDLEALVPFLLREITRGADVQLSREAEFRRFRSPAADGVTGLLRLRRVNPQNRTQPASQWR